MITDNQGNVVDEATALHRLIVAHDLRFPGPNTPGDRLGWLLAQVGELSRAILTFERSPLAGERSSQTPAPLPEVLLDVLQAAGGIAHHYRLPVRVPDIRGYRHSDTDNPYVLFGLLTQDSGALAQTVQHVEEATSVAGELASAVNLVTSRALVLAEHYDLHDALRAVIQTRYRKYQNEGFLLGGAADA